VRYGWLALLLVAGALIYWGVRNADATPAEPPLAAEPAAGPKPAAAQPVVAKAETEIAKRTAAVVGSGTYADAMRLASPLFADAVNDVNPGAVMLAMWFSEHGSLTDVAVSTDETSVRKARKDTDAERGKRLCARGRVVQIEKESVAGIAIWTGNIMTGNMDFVNFMAGGSTGELVQNDYGRLCGVVIGEYAFSNVSGGQTRSIQVVGMFDLPENRR
jgi:hypothetical protein